MPAGPFLRRLRLKNFRSIGKCDVELGPFTVLVGRNGAGKSNVLDSLRFVMEALESSLHHAIKSRGGITEVIRKSPSPLHSFAIQLELEIDHQLVGYGFEVSAGKHGGFVVSQEALTSHAASYRVREGTLVHATASTMPPATDDRLYLVNAAGLPEFRGVYDKLLSMGVYNLSPDQIRKPQAADEGELLHRDGSNIASVIGRFAEDQPATLDRIVQYLHTITSHVTGVKRVSLGSWETLEFTLETLGLEDRVTFHAASISDGTLRALGALVAVAQRSGARPPMSLVGIEEPETALHPAATGALMDALREATAHTQVIITSHSPDLLDQVGDEDRLLAVELMQGSTQIGIVDRASRDAIKAHLYTPGELLRMDQLTVDRDDLARQQALDIFGGGRQE